MREATTRTAIAGLLLVGMIFSSGRAVGDEGGTLVAKVAGVRDDAGEVCVGLFGPDDDYPKMGRARKLVCVKPADGKATVAFKKLELGNWALFAFHDEDGDRRIRKNWIGMPKEGVGASRGAKGFMGPPDFEDAALPVGTKVVTARIRLKYL